MRIAPRGVVRAHHGALPRARRLRLDLSPGAVCTPHYEHVSALPVHDPHCVTLVPLAGWRDVNEGLLFPLRVWDAQARRPTAEAARLQVGYGGWGAGGRRVTPAPQPRAESPRQWRWHRPMLTRARAPAGTRARDPARAPALDRARARAYHQRRAAPGTTARHRARAPARARARARAHLPRLAGRGPTVRPPRS